MTSSHSVETSVTRALPPPEKNKIALEQFSAKWPEQPLQVQIFEEKGKAAATPQVLLGADSAGHHIFRNDCVVVKDTDGKLHLHRVTDASVLRDLTHAVVLDPVKNKDFIDQVYVDTQFKELQFPLEGDSEVIKISATELGDLDNPNVHYQFSFSAHGGEALLTWQIFLSPDPDDDDTELTVSIMENDIRVLKDNSPIKINLVKKDNNYVVQFLRLQLHPQLVDHSKGNVFTDWREKHLEQEKIASLATENTTLSPTFLLENTLIDPQRMAAVVGSIPEDELRRLIQQNQESLRTQEYDPDKLPEQVSKIQQFRAQVQAAQVLVIIGKGGMGDKIYERKAAQILARSYPEKQIYYQDPSDLEIYIPESADLSNFHVIAKLSRKLAQQLRKKKVYVTCFSLTRDAAVETEELQRAAGEDKLSAKILHRYRGVLHNSWLKQAAAIIDNLTGDRGEGHIDQLEKDRDLWRAWRSLVLKPHANTPVHAQFRQLDAVLQGPNLISTVQKNSVHQLEDLASKLVNFFGVKPDLAQTLPNEFVLKTPELPEVKQYDLTIIYDARSNGRTKLLQPKQWIQLINELTTLYPDLKINLVIGFDHTEDSRIILQQCPRVNAVQGSVQEVVNIALRSKVVITVDTGLGHLLNEYIRKYKGTTLQDRLPAMISLMGTGARFSIPYFRLDQATQTFVAAGTVANMDLQEVTRAVQAQLAQTLYKEESSP